jgi:hypothetical protein
MFGFSGTLIKRLAWYLAASVFAVYVIAQQMFAFTRPRTPMPATGRVYPLNVHGTVVYLNCWENVITGGWAFLLIFILGVFWVVLSVNLPDDGK